jgi:hypothetical protein
MDLVIRKPSAWIPIALSIVALSAILVTFALSGPPVPQPDEGTGAHLFQIWLAVEVAMVGFFAVKWLPQKPKQAFIVIMIQIAGILAGCAPVFFLHL